MQRKRTTIIILAVIFAALLIVVFAINQYNGNRYRWYENYDSKSKQPYGLLFIKKMIEGYAEKQYIYNDKKPIFTLLDTKKFPSNTSYIHIGEAVYQGEKDVQALLNFVNVGNTVLFVTNSSPYALLEKLYKDECLDEILLASINNTKSEFSFLHDTLNVNSNNSVKKFSFNKKFIDRDEPYTWQYLEPEIFCTENKSITPIGYIHNGGVNFYRIQYGKGYFYFHTNPLAFTNYQLTKKSSVEYASIVFSHLHKSTIIYDDFAKVPFINDGQNIYNSPLYIILQEPALKFAWWLLLATVILYVLIAAKRQQRIIPVLEPKANTSMAFVELISTLHFQNGNHLEAARKKMKYFFHFIKTRYAINLQQNHKENVKLLAEKSKVKENEIQEILDHYKLIDQYSYTNIEANKLTQLYFSIENFYKKCI